MYARKVLEEIVGTFLMLDTAVDMRLEAKRPHLSSKYTIAAPAYLITMSKGCKNRLGEMQK